MAELVRGVAAGGEQGQRAVEELVLRHLRLAARAGARLDPGDLDPEDLVQEGMVGLVRAAQRATRTNRFAPYAALWVLQAKQRAIAQHALFELDLSEASVPEEGEVAFLHLADLDVEDVGVPDGVPGAEPDLEDDLDLELADVVEEADEDDEDGQPAVSDWLFAHVVSLTERERIVLTLRYQLHGGDADEGFTQREIGEHLDLTAARVQQIEAHALATLRDRIEREAAGLDPDGRDGRTRRAPAARTERPRAGASAGPHAWRPAWWERLRSESEEATFVPVPLRGAELRRVRRYVDDLSEHLDGPEPLELRSWRRSGVGAGAPAAAAERLRAHGHVLAGMLRRFRSQPGPEQYDLLVRAAHFLGFGDDVVERALDDDLSGMGELRLRRGLRVAVSLAQYEYEGVRDDEARDEVHEHARRIGLEPAMMSSKVGALAVVAWDARSRSVDQALRYRTPRILIDDLMDARSGARIPARTAPDLPARRAAVCRRCGVVHTIDAGRVHRRDQPCATCG